MVVVLIDDMGFGASSTYGGPCEMPTAERLAGDGLRYSRFHVTPLCSPTRQALMTGRNHHSVGMGVTSEMSTPEPGYHGYRPASAATIAQILSGNGYCTAAMGKWHQTPPVEVSPSGPFPRWPMGEGFDFFYGFMGAEMNHWSPSSTRAGTPWSRSGCPRTATTSRRTWWTTPSSGSRTSRSSPRASVLHLPRAGRHPRAVPRRGGVAGEVRRPVRRRLGRPARAHPGPAEGAGLVPDPTELAPWAEGVPHWDELDETERRVAARFMETYAGFAEHADVQVGRLVDALERDGRARRHA